MRGRHEFLAAHDEQQVEDVLIEHVPRADLLLDHVEAGLLDVHADDRCVSEGLIRGRHYRTPPSAATLR